MADKFKIIPPRPKPAAGSRRGNLRLEFSAELYGRLVEAAHKSGVSMAEFCRQCIRYGIEQVEKS